jgi:hypothetical protein
MQFRRLASIVAILLGAVPLLGAPAAADIGVSGWTNACFDTGCVPSTQSSLQFTTHLGLLYVNATFAASTASEMLSLGGSPSLPNVDNLGSLLLFPDAASYEGAVLDLRVRVGNATVSVPAVLHGAVAADGSGGVVVDFDDGPHSATLSDGTAVAVRVQDVSLVPGGNVAVGGTVTTGAGVGPVGAVVATPVPGAPPVTLAGAGVGGTTAGGVLPLVLGTVDVPDTPAVHNGEVVPVAVDLTAPVVVHATFAGAVTGTVVTSGTGGYIVDFPDAPVSVDVDAGRVLVISVNDLAVAPGHSGVVTGQVVQPPTNQAPVARADGYTRKKGNHAPVVVTGVLANDTDADGDPLVAELVAAPTQGTVAFLANGMFTYAPAPNYQSDDAFTYRVFDGTVWSAPATVTITTEAPGKSGR